MTGAKLREARKAAGLSMKQAAEDTNTPYRTWQDWEGEKRRVPGLAFAWLELRRTLANKKENWERVHTAILHDADARCPFCQVTGGMHRLSCQNPNK